MWQQIKAGTWLTPQRMRGYSVILLVIAVLASAIWIALADGLVDRNDQPIGTDFSNVWVAGKLVLEGRPEAPFDPVLQHAAEREAFDGRPVPFFGWHYPPLFLIVAAALALLPYGWALLVWTVFGLSVYLVTLRAILPRPETILLALAFPATFVNLGHGQNGFLTASLLGGALLLMDRRPLVAGVLFGLLAYKPQFGLMIPIALLATGRWRVIAAAATTVLAASAVIVALFGTKVWTAFAQSTEFTRAVVLEAGDTGWQKIQSIFSAVRMWGGSVEIAYAAQATLALGVAVSLVWLWRSRAADDLKASALASACLLATPYVLDYDFVVLAIGIAFFVRHALNHNRPFRDYEISVLAFVWIAPLIARSVAETTGLPLGLLAMVSLYVLTLRRAVLEGAGRRPSAEALARA